MKYFFFNIRSSLYPLKTKKQLKSERIEILIQNLSDGVVLLDLDFKIVYISQQALNLLNWEFNEVYETNFLKNFEIGIGKIILSKLENLFHDKRVLSFKLQDEIIIQSNNYFNETILLVFKIALKQEKIIGIVLTVRNITKEIKINKKKVNFLSNISHELRTPLFNIQSFIQTLDQHSDKLEQREIKEFLGITNKEVLRLNRLVNTILDFSKFNCKNLYLFSAININDVFNQLIPVYSIRAGQKKIKIKKEIEKDLPFILGKKDLLLQVFDNLLGNALKFSSYRGTILCRAYTVSNNNLTKIRVEIGDTGLGITKIDQTKIFKRFSRANSETKIIYGTGLGLSIVKKILQKHGSKFHLKSNVNEGTIFFIDFILTDKI